MLDLISTIIIQYIIMNLIKFILLLTFLGLFYSQTCSHLCVNDCRNTSCNSCYSNFLASSQSISSCECPTQLYKWFFNSTTQYLCLPCPATCQTCVNYFNCTTCISGFILNNNYRKCIPGNQNTNINQWISKNISLQIIYNETMTSNIVVINATSQTLLNQTNFNSFLDRQCYLYNTYNLLGQFRYNTKIIKSSFNLPPHNWINIKMQVFLGDNWINNTLLLEIDRDQSLSLNSLSSPEVLWSGKIDNTKRFMNICGANYPDSIAIIDVWTSHSLSSNKIRIRLNQSQNVINSSSNLNNLYFGIRQIFIRVGTCGRFCDACDSPDKCLKCIWPYTLSNGSCLCQAPNGLPSRLIGCEPKCYSDQFYNSTIKTCEKCQKVLPRCKTCNDTDCLTCEVGFFYFYDSVTNQDTCYKKCPSGTTQTRGVPLNIYSQYDNSSVFRDSCTPCPANCSECIQNICTYCKRGYLYYKGQCLDQCPSKHFIIDGQCHQCSENCHQCSSYFYCYKCAEGYGFDQVVQGCRPLCMDNTTIAGYFNQTCMINCSENCLFCFGQQSNQCTSCKNGFKLHMQSCISDRCPVGTYQANSGNLVCKQCHYLCSQCINSDICLSCIQGYYLKQQKCFRICPLSYYPQQTNRTCSSCSVGCEICVNSQLCTQCNSGYILFNSNCLSNNPLNYYFDDDFGYFKSCRANCEICQKQICFKCKDTYYLDQQDCVTDCGSDKFKIIKNFIRQNTRGNQSITTGFCEWRSPLCSIYNQASLNGSCLKCSTFIPVLFKDNYQMDKINCIYNCPLYFYRSNTGCSPCPQNCRICTSYNNCIQCQYNYVINAPQVLAASSYNKICVLHYCNSTYVSDTNQCQQCPKGCQYCQINGLCSSCLNGYTLLNYQCRPDNNCLDGYYQQSSSCLLCDSTCKRCFSSTNNSCISCKNPYYYLRSSYSCVLSCPIGYFDHYQSLSCRLCNPLCQTCLSLSNCTSCINGFYLLSFYDSNNIQCIKQCPLGFWSDTKTCFRCYEDCRSCYGPSEYQCLSCYGNFYLDESKCVYTCGPGKYKDKRGHCDWCHPSCPQCSGPMKKDCIKCQLSNYYFSDGLCYANSCPGATYLAITSQNICERCQFGCQYCQSPQFCDFCTPGYYLYRGWCYLTCPGDTVGTTARFPNLLNIEGYICGDCLTKYSSKCLSCDLSSCKKCQSGYYLYRSSSFQAYQNGKLVKQHCVTACPSGNYVQSLQNLQCIPCATNCLICNSYTNCTKCNTGLFIVNGYCSANCPSGFYINLGTNCTACPSKCRTCLSSINCTSCNIVNSVVYYLYYNVTTFTCITACPNGFYAENGVCLRCLSTCTKCQSSTSCSQCLFGYNLVNGICTNTTTIVCSANCQTCTSANCLMCISPSLLFINTLTGFSSCVSSCPSGYYPSTYSCLSCNCTCLSCDNSPNNCTSCRPGLFLHEKTCITLCPQGFYADITTGLCTSCLPKCISCVSATQCIICQSGYNLYNNLCYQICPQSTYQSYSINQCFKCPQKCSACSNIEKCTSCKIGFAFYNGSCISNCPQTTYLQGLNSLQKNCAPCVAPCYTCTDSTTCTTCIPNYILNGTFCQQSCNNGYYLKIDYTDYQIEDQSYSQIEDQSYSQNSFHNYYSCVLCGDTCATCTNSSTNCLTCTIGYVLFNNDCLKQCPRGTYNKQNKCLQCPNYCQLCQNGDYCITCYATTFNNEGKCQIQCPRGSFYEIQTSTQTYCRPCHVNCSSCLNITSQSCTSCNQGKYLINNTCLEVCPRGFYADNITSTCNKCNYLCTLCYNFNYCTACMSGYILSSTNKCIFPTTNITNSTINNTNITNCMVSNCFYCNPTNYNRCQQCKTSYYLVNNTCVNQCPNMTYSSNIYCLNCSENCLNCDSTNCFICKTNTYLYLGKCYDQCPLNTIQEGIICKPNPCIYYDRTSNNCLLCSAPFALAYINSTMMCTTICPNKTTNINGRCVNCSLNCLSCLTESFCSICSNGTYAFEGKCVYVCPAGTIPSNNQCTSCTKMYCSSCLFYNNIQRCTKCTASSGTYLYNGSCVFQCPSDFYQETISLTCRACSIGCIDCLNSTVCRNCSSNFFLYKGQCILTCPLGTYISSNLCLPCNSSCLTCISAQNCSSCSSLFYMLPASINLGISRCLTVCPTGYYPRSILQVTIVNTTISISLQQQCALCISPCLTCKSSSICLSCVNNFTLSGSLCIQNCPSGTYRAVFSVFQILSISVTTYNCRPCSSVCLTCVNSSTNCLTCYSGFILTAANDCVSNCSSSVSFYNTTTRVCINCSQNCFTCYGSNTNNCLSCKPPLQLYQGICYTTCPFAFYSSSTYTCQPCSSSCAGCSLSASNCTTCDLPSYLQSQNGIGKCVIACSSGFYLNQQLGLCQKCNSSCLNCFGALSHQCLSCNVSFYLINGSCTNSCPSGTANIITQTQRYCKLCNTGCKQCYFNASSPQQLICTLCSSDLYLFNGNCLNSCPISTYLSLSSFQCITCPMKGCKSCSSASNCFVCQSTFYMLDGACVSVCPPNYSAVMGACVPKEICQLYIYTMGTTTLCVSSCPVGTYPSTQDQILKCQACQTNCLSCSGQNKCSSCNNNSKLLTLVSNSTITNTICVLYCPVNYYQKDRVCLLCPSTCLNCNLVNNSVSCLSCKSGYILLASICVVSCPKGYYALSTSTLNYCKICPPQCATCVNQYSCLECTNKLSIIPSCLSTNCTNGYYLSENQQCSPCDPICLTCYGGSTTQCLSCASNLVFYNGLCSINCPNGMTKVGNSCQICPSGCQNCSILTATNQTVCNSCYSPLMLAPYGSSKYCVIQCRQLNTGLSSYINNNGSCTLCNLSNCLLCRAETTSIIRCLQCQNNTYMYNSLCYQNCPNNTYPSNTLCMPCQAHCLTCSSLGCTSCIPSSTLSLLLNHNCISACPERYYKSNDTCIQCNITNCLSCNGQICSNCQQPYKLDTNFGCSNCISGYFLNSTACLICSPQCTSCISNRNNCLQCSSGYVLLANKCVTACPAGYLLLSGACQLCPLNCDICESINICSKCKNGFALLISSNMSTCINSCPNSTYLDSTINLCITCSPNCTNCTSALNCMSCSSSSILYQGYCISSCPSGFTNINQTCLPCLTGCRLCGPMYNCTSCGSGFTLLSSGTCVVTPNNCSNGYYLNALSSCSQCFPTCNTCNGGQSTNCLSCFNGYRLTNGVCLQQCSINFYLDSANSICRQCSSRYSNCSTCTQTSCTSCLSGFMLSSGICIRSCPNGTYLSNSQCLSCSSYCSICTSSNICLNCTNSSILLYMNQCYTQCPVQTYFVNNFCSTCFQTCLTCISSSTNCTSCVSPYNLYNRTCVINCPNGTFISNYLCTPCSTNCIGCTDLNTCIVCTSNFYLVNGTCRSTCPAGFYVDVSSGRCLQCVLPCMTCNSRTNCTSCQTPAVLSNNLCISNCSSGKYWDYNLSQCVNCSISNCSYCNNISCFSCSNTSYTFYANGAIANCIYTCINGYYADNVTRNCSSCFDKCQICNNATYCTRCTTGYYLFTSSFGSNECVNVCPLGYYPLSILSSCAICSSNCKQCINSTTCELCHYNFFLHISGNNASCLNTCPQGYYTPTIINGSGACGLCPSNCSSCYDALTCSSCLSNYVLYNTQCIPPNCVNCNNCLNGMCLQCNINFFVFNNRCVSRCPDRYYNSSNGFCLPCIAQCIWCQDSSTCKLCTTNNIFINGSGCINQGFATFGIIGNMSGFTSNITQIMSTVYVATSAGPIAFGAIGSTYGVMGFGQALYLLQNSTNNNSEMNHFLSSLSSICYINNPNSASSNSTTQSSVSRLLQQTTSSASFIETNVPIFVIMICFVSLYIACLIFDRYDGCCASCPNLLRYLHHICDFMKKRFKFIYVDTIMWISYMPFLYFAIMQLKLFNFNNGLHSLSSILAMIIVVIYPIYPFYILKHLFDKTDDDLTNLVNYKAITWKLPQHYSEEENSMCKNFQCCPKQNPDTSIIEMSLSPFIDKVIRPVFNEDIPQFSQFRYFTKDHFKLAIAPIRYIKKFLFIMIVALSSNPVLSLSLLITITGVFIIYLIVLKPREKLYLIIQILIESFLLIFLIFMLMYILDGGSKVTYLSIATHAFGFLIANSALAIAIVLNILAYYTIFCCIIDLMKYLKTQVQKDEKMQKKLNDIIDEQKFLQINNINRQDDDDNSVPHKLLLQQKERFNDKQQLQLKQSKQKRGDDEMTVENNEEDYIYDQFNLDEKQFDIRGTKTNANNAKIQINNDQDEIPNLKLSEIKRRKDKKGSQKLQQGSATSEEMAQSNLIENQSDFIQTGLIRSKQNKFKRQVNKDGLNVEKGLIRQTTDKYKRQVVKDGLNVEKGLIRQATDKYKRKIQKKYPEEQQSSAYLFKPQNKKQQFVADIDTHDRLQKEIRSNDNIEEISYKNKKNRRNNTNKQIEDGQVQQGVYKQRDNKNKNKNNAPNGNLHDLNTYERENNQKNNLNYNPNNINTYERDNKGKNLNNRQIPQGKFKEKNLVQNPFEQFDEFLNEPKINDIPNINTNDRKNNNKKLNNNQLFNLDEDYIAQPKMNERQNANKKIQNKLYKGSDDEEIGQVKMVEKNRNNFRRNVKKNENEEQQIKNINAYGKDINSKKKQGTKGFVQDELQGAQYKNIQTKKANKEKNVYDEQKRNDERGIQQAKGYDHEKRKINRNKQQDNEEQLQNARAVEREKKIANKKDKPSFFNNMDDDLVQSIEISQPKYNKRAQQEYFQEQNMGKQTKEKKQSANRNKDNKLKVESNLVESYDDIIRKNKQQIFKNPIKNKSNLLSIEGDDDEFEEVTYSRPQSKRSDSLAKNKDSKLKASSNIEGDSEDQSKEIRKQRNSAMQKLRSKGNLNVNDKSQQLQDNVSSDSRRISKLVIKKKKVKAGNLNISDLSENDDLEQITL